MTCKFHIVIYLYTWIVSHSILCTTFSLSIAIWRKVKFFPCPSYYKWFGNEHVWATICWGMSGTAQFTGTFILRNLRALHTDIPEYLGQFANPAVGEGSLSPKSPPISYFTALCQSDWDFPSCYRSSTFWDTPKPFAFLFRTHGFRAQICSVEWMACFFFSVIFWILVLYQTRSQQRFPPILWAVYSVDWLFL